MINLSSLNTFNTKWSVGIKPSIDHGWYFVQLLNVKARVKEIGGYLRKRDYFYGDGDALK